MAYAKTSLFQFLYRDRGEVQSLCYSGVSTEITEKDRYITENFVETSE
jgi:hypothetical protein